LKLLVDADDWPFLAKRNLYFIFSALPVQKRSHATVHTPALLVLRSIVLILANNEFRIDQSGKRKKLLGGTTPLCTLLQKR